MRQISIKIKARCQNANFLIDYTFFHYIVKRYSMFENLKLVSGNEDDGKKKLSSDM